MSIYGSRRDHSLDDRAWERALLKGQTPQAEPTAECDWARLRKAAPYDRLLPASRAWLNSLPSASRPILLAVQYPRIVNLLAQQWNDTAACRAYLDDLLVGRRPDRGGFSADVRKDIWDLREYFVLWRLLAGGDSAVVE